jgi:hypothetical protein
MDMRPALRDKWIEADANRREELTRLAAGRVRPPIFIKDQFDPHSLSSRLMAA